MAEIEMPPQYAGDYADPKDTEGHVLAALRTLASERVTLIEREFAIMSTS